MEGTYIEITAWLASAYDFYSIAVLQLQIIRCKYETVLAWVALLPDIKGTESPVERCDLVGITIIPET